MVNVAILTMVILSQPVSIPMVYGLAECSSWPINKEQLESNGISVVAIREGNGRVLVRLKHKSSGRKVNAVAFNLGQREVGWTFWSVRSPTSIAIMIAESPECRIAVTYQQALSSWTTEAKDWLKEKSTCLGVATWRGRSYTMWPCSWSISRSGEGTITSIDAVGPGVMMGGSLVDASGYISP
jgi:hypothetical protein